MVAVVSGSGLGLVNTSREVAGQSAGLGNATLGAAGEGVSVNAATGNLVIQDHDEFLAGIGPDIDLLRTYNSKAGWDGDNGDGWRIGYYRRVSGVTGGTGVNTTGSSVKRVDADGFESTYTYDGSRYVGKDGAGAFDTLSFNASLKIWTWTDGDTGVTDSYAETGTVGTYRLTRVTDPEGNYIKVDYDTAGLINKLSTWKSGATSADESIALTYDNATNKRLQQAVTNYQDQQGATTTRTRIRYEYDSSGRLLTTRTDLTPEDNKVLDGKAYVVSYGYDSSGRVNKITQGDGTSLSIEYDATTGQVNKLTDGLTQPTLIAYDTTARKTTVTDPTGQVTTLSYDIANRLKEISGAVTGGASFKQSFDYDVNGHLKTSTNPRGELTTFDNDQVSGVLLRSTDAAGNVVERSYDSANRQTAVIRYTAPDADGPGGTAVASGPLKTLAVYDTGKRRVRFTLSPEGRVVQYDYDPYGRRIASTAYVNNFYTASASPTLTDLTNWVNGLSVTDRAAAEHHDFGYDLRGQLISDKAYAANTVSNGAVVLGGMTQTQYVRDAFGRLLQTIDATSNATVYAYDGLGRVTATTDGKKVTTFTAYDDAANTVTVKFDNGLTTVSAYDKADRLVSTAQMQSATANLGTTLYFYDADGRLLMTQDPTGVRTFNVYDATGRQTAAIDGTGQLTESVYDGAGRLLQTVQYATLLSATALAGLVDSNGKPAVKTVAQLRPAADATADRITTRFYDKAGRLTAIQDPEGAVTESQYDGADRLVKTLRYATVTAITRLDTSAGQTIAAPPAYSTVKPAADAANDRTTRNLYSNDGLLRGTLDAEGYLVEKRYDAGGRLVEQIAYATVTDSAQRASGTLEQLKPASVPASDARTVWLYDGKGQVIGAIDADSYLTETSYDEAGRRSKTIRYAKTAVGTITTTSTLANVRPGTSQADQSTSWKYDELGRVKLETASDGTTQTQFNYDSVGNLTSTVQAVGQSDARTQAKRFDVQGRLVGELSAEGATQLVANQSQAAIEAIWSTYGTTYTYDVAGHRTSMRDPRGNTTVYYYDAAGRQVFSILKTSIGGEVQQTGYNAFGDTTNQVGYAYSRLPLADTTLLQGGLADAVLTAKINALTNSTLDAKRTAVYNRRSQIQQAIDGLGNVSIYQYNAFGQQSSSTVDVYTANPANIKQLRTDSVYDRRGLLSSTTQDPNVLKVVNTTTYDAFGRVLTRTDGRQLTTSFQYAENDGSVNGGPTMTVTDPTTVARKTVYDAFHRVLRQQDGVGNYVIYNYDAVARKSTMTTAEGVTVITEANSFGQVYKVTDGAQAPTTYAYDHDGNLLTTTDALGNVTANVYDAAGNKTQTSVGLKSNGTAAPTNDGSAVTTAYTFDAANRVLTQQIDPGAGGLKLTTSFAYDGVGRIYKTTDPLNVITSYNFDAKGQVKQKIVDNGAGGLKLSTTYDYDDQSRTISISQGTHQQGMSYDVLGRQTYRANDPGNVLYTVNTFDASGNLVLEKDASGKLTRHVYDAANRLKYTIDSANGVTQSLYDGEGRLVGVRAFAKRFKDTVVDLSLSALTDATIETTIAGLTSAADQLTQYAYNKDGQRIYTIDAEGAVTQQKYDKAGRVVETIRYATLKPGAWTATSTPTADAARDQSTQTVYDKLGQVRFQVDPLNFVTEFVHDRAGRVVTTKRYAQAVARIANPLEADMAAAVKADAANDRVEHAAFDAAGRQRFSIDAEGYITEQTFDATGHVIDTLRSSGKASFTVAPTVAQAQAAFTSLKTFDTSDAGVAAVTDVSWITGIAHVYDSGRLKLYSKAESGGNWAATRSTAADAALGASVQADVTIVNKQHDTHIAIESRATGRRLAARFRSDGHVWAQVLDPNKSEIMVDLGAYTVGATYRVEFTTSAAGATLYVYDATKTRDSGLIYRTDHPLALTGFSPIFYMPRDPSLVGEADAYVDNLVERAGTLMSSDRYDAAGRLVASVDGEGNVTRYAYDTAGHRTSKTTAAGLSEASTTTWKYDTADRVIEETTAAGTTRFLYTAQYLSATIDPRGVALAESNSTWAVSERQKQGLPADAAALTTAQKQAFLTAYTTRYTYDAVGRRTVVTDALGKTTTTTYDAFGNAAKVVDARGFTSYSIYDKRNRVAQRIDAEQYLTDNDYDAFGNLTDSTRYDARVGGTLAIGTPVVIGTADPGGGQPFVIAAAAVDAASHSEFNRRNQLLWQRDAEGYIEGSLVALDAFGERTAIVNKVGGTASYVYDRRGLVLKETLPVKAAKADNTPIDVVNQHTYDSRGNRIQTIEAVGLPEQRTTNYAFDNNNRLVRKIGMAFTVADGTQVTPVDQFDYDGNGNVIEQITAANLVDLAVVGGRRSLAYYDAAQQKIAEISADGVLSQSTYDAAGRLVRQKILATRLAALPAAAGGTPPAGTASADDRSLNYSYDVLGRKTVTTLDGLWSWEGLDSGAAVGLPGAESVAIQRLAYDAVGNIIQRIDGRGNASYAYYDGIGRQLLAIDQEGYATAWDYGRAQGGATNQTRYAAKLSSYVAQSVSGAATSSSNDPAALRRAAVAATDAMPAAQKEPSRTTTFAYDRLGRVKEQRVKDVQTESVQTTGTRTQSTADAVTQTTYDGLGHATQIRQLADASGTWEVTDIGYDQLGRETSRQAPGFTDFEGQAVRPRTDTDYDGLGDAKRRTQRGKTTADDRISLYTYDANGRLIQETDPLGAVTQYALDAQGEIAKRTNVNVKRSDGTVRSLVTTYQRDAAGRIVKETADVDATGTVDVKQTAYNAFGEVSQRGDAFGMEEFSFYTTLGKIWKSNAGDGVYKIYLQDKNGNVTREIRPSSSVSLKDRSIDSASADSTLLMRTSLYDKRNQLIRSFDPQIKILTDTNTLSQQFGEQWVPQYGDLNTTESPGGSLQGGTVGQTAYTTVTTSAGSSTPLSNAQPGIADDGISFGTAPVGTPLTVGNRLVWSKFSVSLEASKSAPTTSFNIPSDWPDGTYRVTESYGSTIKQVSVGRGGSVTVGAAIATTSTISYVTHTIKIEWQNAANQPWISIVSSAAFDESVERNPDVVSPQSTESKPTPNRPPATYTYSYAGFYSVVQASRRIVLQAAAWSGASSFIVTVDPDGGAPVPVAAIAVADGLLAFDLPSGLAAGQHALRILGVAGNGADLVSGADAQFDVDGSGNPNVANIRSITALGHPDQGLAWSDYTGGQRALVFGPFIGPGSTNSSIRYRPLTDGAGAWSGPIVFNQNAWDTRALNTNSGTYEFIVQDSAGNAKYGQFTINNNSVVAANIGALQTIVRSSEKIAIESGGNPNVHLFIEGSEVGADSNANGQWVFNIAPARRNAGIGDWDAGRPLSYRYTIADSTGKNVGFDSGTITSRTKIVAGGDGSSFELSSSNPARLQPVGRIDLPGASGTLTLSSGGGQGQTIQIGGNDFRVQRDDQGLFVNLQDYEPAWGSSDRPTVQFRYDSNSGRIVTGAFTVDGNGTVTASGPTVNQTQNPRVAFNVPGAVTMRAFRVGPYGGSLSQVAAGELSGSGPGFQWDTTNRRGQDLGYEFEALDSNGTLVGKGSGRVTVAADGTVTQVANVAAPVRATITLQPPAGAAGLQFALHRQDLGGADSPRSPAHVDAAGNGLSNFVYAIDDLVPPQSSGPYTWIFSFTSTAADGSVLTKGTGTLIVNADRTTRTEAIEEQRAVPVKFKLGRAAAQAQIKISKGGTPVKTITVPGIWVPPVSKADGSPGTAGYTRFDWNAGPDKLPADTYDYQLIPQTSSGVQLTDELGRPVQQTGRLILDPSGAQPAKLLEKVAAQRTASNVLVARNQVHNAFGEVTEEFDDRVAERMQAMLGGAVLSQAQKDAARTTLRYNAMGVLTSKSDPETSITLANGYAYRDRPVTRYGYDLLGRVVTSTDANGNLSKQTVLAGSPASGTTPGAILGDWGLTDLSERDSAGVATAQFFADGGVRTVKYDIFGDARTITDQNGSVTRQTYDKASRLTRVDRDGVQRLTDANATKGAAATLTSTYTYDQLGQRLSATDAVGTGVAQISKTDYDGLGRIVQTTDALGLATKYQYAADVNGLTLITTHSDGRATIDKTDDFGHATWHQDLGGTQSTYSYDLAGRLTGQTSTAGQNIGYQYYANGYISGITDNALATQSDYGYDNAGNRTYEAYFQLQSGSRSASYQIATIRYDELGRMAGAQDANYFDIRYEYDAQGNRRLVQSTYWDGVGGQRGSLNAGGQATQTYWYDYDPMNRFKVTKGTLNGARSTNKTDASKVIAGPEGTLIG